MPVCGTLPVGGPTPVNGTTPLDAPKVNSGFVMGAPAWLASLGDVAL